MNSDIDYLHQTIALAGQSRAEGNHPFGALLVARMALSC